MSRPVKSFLDHCKDLVTLFDDNGFTLVSIQTTVNLSYNSTTIFEVTHKTDDRKTEMFIIDYREKDRSFLAQVDHYSRRRNNKIILHIDPAIEVKKVMENITGFAGDVMNDIRMDWATLIVDAKDSFNGRLDLFDRNCPTIQFIIPVDKIETFNPLLVLSGKTHRFTVEQSVHITLMREKSYRLEGFNKKLVTSTEV